MLLQFLILTVTHKAKKFLNNETLIYPHHIPDAIETLFVLFSFTQPILRIRGRSLPMNVVKLVVLRHENPFWEVITDKHYNLIRKSITPIPLLNK